MIERATVWNLTDDQGQRCEQAAMIREWRALTDAAPELPR
ncbi:MEKHLA domain-containing protein [Candidatus Competibacter denitrificans]